MSNTLDPRRNAWMLNGPFARRGYDWWWHSFTAVNDRTGEEKAFFVEFFTCNPALGGQEPVLGQLPENREKGIRPSYLMVKAGCWGEGRTQLHRFFGWNDVKIRKGAPYLVEAADCLASDRELRGSISVTPEEKEAHPEWMCDAGSMSWDLKLDKKIAFNVGYGASGLFRAIKAFEMYWHAEGIKTLVSGTVVMNGETYTVVPERSYGYADKNWGRGFTSPWVWLSSWDLVSEITGKRAANSAFDIGGGRPKIYFVPLNRKLLGAFTLEGKDYEFNFSKFWTGSRTEFSSSETEAEILWHVRQETFRHVMVTEIRCDKKDMLLVNYEDPDGRKRHNRLWNGGNGHGTIELYEKVKKAGSSGGSGNSGSSGSSRDASDEALGTAGGLKLIDRFKVGHVGCEYGEYER